MNGLKTLGRHRDTDEIVRRLRTVRPESVRRWGRMSAHQMVCHLSDSFRMVLGQKPVRDASGRLERTLVKWIALYVPVRWPTGLLTRPEIDQHDGGTRPIEFAADIAELEALLTLFRARKGQVHGLPHPIFGRMSQRSWLRWAYLHMDHHLRQFGS